jgi:RecA/RadA recombinase
MGTMKSADLKELVRHKIEHLRPKLLDLSRRNPLLATKLSPRSNAHIRAVDELPDVLFYKLNNGQEMRLIPLPEIADDPRDEDTKAFRDALANARLTDELYLTELESIERDADDYLDRTRQIERALKDRIRADLGMPPRPKQQDINLAQHARNNGITPSYDLPQPDSDTAEGRHTDDDIQTLLLPKDLERKLNNITSKCRTWIQETGINVLHVAYGFLEWSEPNQTDTAYAPLVLCSAQIEKKRTREGAEFRITGTGEEPEVNAVLAEKMRIEFGIELPRFDGTSVEEYLSAIAQIAPRQIVWKVRRQVAIGVFPSARMAMYHDIDPKHPAFPDSEIVRSLLGGSNSEAQSPFAEEYNVDEPAIEQSVPCVVMDADSSQFSTLVDIANGKNLAVEGPPGTGKSQTIVNAIAAALAEGKKVLFVAEKLAALNVVRARLEAVGLGEFLLPLQAERSTREQVIESVRTRVEMRRPGAVRDYDDQIAEFRRIRQQLADYIDLLTLNFGASGMTIHEILGRSIATAPRLEAVPAAIIEQSKISETYLHKAGIGRLRALGEAVEKAAAQAAAAKPHWKATGLTHAERFTVEEACNLAARASEALRTLRATREGLANHGLAFTTSDHDLAALLAALGELEALTDTESGLHLALLAKDAAAHLAAFIAGCENCAALERDLAALLAADVTAVIVAAVERIQSICRVNELETLDWNALQRGLESKRVSLQDSRTIASAMAPLISVKPEASEWSLAAIGKAAQIIATAGREALARRNTATNDPSALPLLQKLIVEGKSLQEERAELAKHVSFSIEAPVEALTGAIATLRGAGYFSLFSASFRSAKRLTQSLSLAERFDKRDALNQLEKLAGYRSRERSFLHNPQAVALFGLHFRGVDTDFGPFERLSEYYASIQAAFARPELRALRNFLRDADLDDLETIPALSDDAPVDTLSTLQTDLADAEQRTTALGVALEELRSFLRVFHDPASVSPASLPGLIDKMKVVLEKRAALKDDGHAAGLLGSRFDGSRTDTVPLKPACAWAQSAAPVALQLAAILRSGDPKIAARQIESVVRAQTQVDTLLDSLSQSARIDTECFTGGRDEIASAAAFEAASQDAEGLFAHAGLATALAELSDTGTEPLVTHCLASGLRPDLAARFEALAVRKLARAVYEAHGKKLSRYPGTRLDELRAALARQDREIIKLAQKQLRWKVNADAKPPYGNGMGKKSTWTQMALIDNEISKQQRFISVRDLTQRAGQALLELKPCWMMSPLAVAQYVPKGSLHFHLCIIDEASQMPPEAAIGALLRCDQTVVVGDTNQLPPSSFFRKMIDDEDADEDDAVLNESILEMANATFRPARRLRWHYRSRHSGLIKFSNKLVYNDDLIVFPSATESMSRMGVEYRKVDGLYKAGTNATEARIMVDAALEFMRTDPNRSLGIVTLNQKQRDLIAEEFEYALGRDRHAQAYVDAWKLKHDGLEEFFIKNLENVQGDERDVIYIGTVYGPEVQNGKTAQRFGPINGLAGKRRLNVLFSRAKEKIVTFSSMTAADIVAEETGNAGAYMLKRWLEYAAVGVLDSGTTTAKEPDSEFEVFVMDQIRAIGCEPVPQVGVAGYFIDIGVKHPDWPHGFILGVECDGASYHSAKSARDRDRLRQEVLERLGWHFHRIWSTDWFNNPRREAERMRQVIAARMKALKARESEFLIQPAPVDRAAAIVLPPRDPTPQAELPIFAPPPTSSKPLKHTDNRGVTVGDTVRVRYLNGDGKVLMVTISTAKSDLDKGVIHYEAPIAKALLGAEQGDEVEVLNGPYVRPAVVEEIIKHS